MGEDRDAIAAAITTAEAALDAFPYYLSMTDTHTGHTVWCNAPLRALLGDRVMLPSDLSYLLPVAERVRARVMLDEVARTGRSMVTLRASYSTAADEVIRAVAWPLYSDRLPARFVVHASITETIADDSICERWLESWPNPVVIALGTGEIVPNRAAVDEFGFPPGTSTSSGAFERFAADHGVDTAVAHVVGSSAIVSTVAADGTRRVHYVTVLPGPPHAPPGSYVYVGHEVTGTAADLGVDALTARVAELSANVVASARGDERLLARLTPREREIATMLLDGLRVSHIAERLFVSEHTVRNHLRAIFRKCEVGSQAELISRLRD